MCIGRPRTEILNNFEVTGWLHVLGSDSFHPCRFSRVWTIGEKSKVVCPKCFRADNVICSFGTFLLPAARYISDNEEAGTVSVGILTTKCGSCCKMTTESKFWHPAVSTRSRHIALSGCFNRELLQCSNEVLCMFYVQFLWFQMVLLLFCCLTCWIYQRATLCTPQSEDKPHQASRAENNENHLIESFYTNSI